MGCHSISASNLIPLSFAARYYFLYQNCLSALDAPVFSGNIFPSWTDYLFIDSMAGQAVSLEPLDKSHWVSSLCYAGNCQ